MVHVAALKEISKEIGEPSRWHQAVGMLQDRLGLSEWRACHDLGTLEVLKRAPIHADVIVHGAVAEPRIGPA